MLWNGSVSLKTPILFCSWFTYTPEKFTVWYSSFLHIFSYSLEGTFKKVSWGQYSKWIKSDKKILCDLTYVGKILRQNKATTKLVIYSWIETAFIQHLLWCLIQVSDLACVVLYLIWVKWHWFILTYFFIHYCFY